MLDLSRAYVESVVHKCFLRAVEGCVDHDCRRALHALADTYALHTISQDMLFRWAGASHHQWKGWGAAEG